MAARPSPAILGALLLHAGVGALFLLRGLETEDEIVPMISSVPVSIVSEQVIEAAVPDNPSEELVTEEAATAPVEAPPEPTPPAPTPPTPSPPVRRPTPTPTPRPTPAPTRPAPRPTPTPPRPTPTPPRATPPAPARPTPARPAPTPTRPAGTTRPTPSLDLDSLAGPRRPAATQGTRAPTGQQGAGRAPQATGPQTAAIFRQVEPTWPTAVCEDPNMRVTLDVTLSVDGRVVGGPTLVSPRSDGSYRIAAEGVLRAFRQVGTFDVPAGFAGGRFRPSFITQTVCRGR